ncbi:hypothetical protein [Pseudonocardia sp. H11422]|nr:hypothetical protein [Pseudonocardia sp. H11422]
MYSARSLVPTLAKSTSASTSGAVSTAPGEQAIAALAEPLATDLDAVPAG